MEGMRRCVDKSLNYMVVESMRATIYDVLECITIEISVEKNVIVSCGYKAPGSNTEISKDSMEGMFAERNQMFHSWRVQYKPVTS